MNRNPVRPTLLLCLTILLLLGIASAIPAFKVGKWKFRKIDLLSTVRSNQTTQEAIQEEYRVLLEDTIHVQMDAVAKQIEALCPTGITCIEDYSADSTALYPFLKSLLKIKKSKKPLRIAFYGDSFIEGDVFCGAVRDTLQTLFGGRGVGYVPVTSHVAGFRNTIRHAFDHWKTYSLISKKDSTDKVDIGPAGFTFKALPDNWIDYRVSKQRYLREFNDIRMFYSNFGEGKLNYTINDSIVNEKPLRQGKQLRELKIEYPKAKRIQVEVDPADSVYLYGASFESGEGVYVDNFSMRGNSGVALYDMSDRLLKDFNQLREYKLVILQFGLNVIRDDSGRYNWYANKMIRVVNKMKEAFPTASILLLSVSDRGTNIDGEYKTIPSIPALRNTQRYIAKETGIAFWDLYAAMGGENSMVDFVEADPPLAAKDYTHLTFKGGKKLASKLVNSLLYELERYEKEGQHP